nr:immunoglobulin light chain junction region [Macaca mulatta]
DYYCSAWDDSLNILF